MIAVLTGDIVNSTKMSKQVYADVIKSLKGFLQDVNTNYAAAGEIYRGDEFQIQYPIPADALKSTLLIKLALHLSEHSTKPILCTLSLAYGDYDTYDEKPNTSTGPVFIESGRRLSKTQRGELSIHFKQVKAQSTTQQSAQDQDDILALTKLLTDFLNHLLNRLTKTQAQLLYQYIEHDFPDHKKMAEITETSRQNISNRLSNIGAYLVRDYIELINNKIALIGDNN